MRGQLTVCCMPVVTCASAIRSDPVISNDDNDNVESFSVLFSNGREEEVEYVQCVEKQSRMLSKYTDLKSLK